MPETATKERPIIFSGPMINAINARIKSQTRRVMKPQPAYGFTPEPDDYGNWLLWTEEHKFPGSHIYHCPYGLPGDRLWVKETFFQNRYDNGGYEEGLVRYCADEDDFAMDNPETKTVKRPSIHMPRWASRITLEIVAVRVERVQDISEHDAEAEGARDMPLLPQGFRAPTCTPSDADMRSRFSGYWDSIYAKKGFGWDANPWAWVIEFKREE